ncbi:ATP-binding protein [Flavobacterium sp. GNP001]
MQFYSQLSKISFLRKRYAFKFLFVAFVGIHLPLIGLVFFVLFGKEHFSAESAIYFILVVTLLATSITLWALKLLIKPIELASKALSKYRKKRIIPQLPTNFQDEAGLLLANIQSAVIENERFIDDKQDLVYLLSHDLRAFAANAKTLATLIVDEKGSAEVTEFAHLIEDSMTQQLEMIGSFIKLIHAEEEASKKSKKLTPVSIDSLVAQIQLEMEAKLKSKNIKFQQNIKLLSVKLKIDVDLLTRVLVNVVANALKFSFENSHIEFSVFERNQRIIFEIKDYGIGFDPDKVPELFQKFTSRSRTGTAGENSTGIGLYLCKKIVEKFDGEISAVSVGVNKGATFTISLPSFD